MTLRIVSHIALLSKFYVGLITQVVIKTHNSESRGQEEAAVCDE